LGSLAKGCNKLECVSNEATKHALCVNSQRRNATKNLLKSFILKSIFILSYFLCSMENDLIPVGGLAQWLANEFKFFKNELYFT